MVATPGVGTADTTPAGNPRTTPRPRPVEAPHVFTFVIPAHNEQASIATIVGQAIAAAQPGDRVLVVDSASTDATAHHAAAAGAEVLPGPRGKGAAMAVAIANITTPWVCFLDADLISSQTNVPAALRQAAASGTADHILGDYEYADPGTILASTFTIYQPLVAEFFPEVGHLGANSLSGYRAIRRRYLDRPLPAHFGVEAHLNISIAMAGGTAAVRHLGVIGSRFKYKPDMCREIACSILDLATAHHRLHPDHRPSWQAWIDQGAAAISQITATSGRSTSLARLFAAARRPMPARTHHTGDTQQQATASPPPQSTDHPIPSDGQTRTHPSQPHEAERV
ncbi:MAG: glycosyltransferase [Micromonosporaceae bacterium]|nr:glycosyltransferase [Micromonosporaceae bacterium]